MGREGSGGRHRRAPRARRCRIGSTGIPLSGVGDVAPDKQLRTIRWRRHVVCWGVGMPRTERPLEDDGGLLTAFAADLRRLREKAGKPTYRKLAALAHYSSSTLADAAGGRKLPSLEVT